MDERDDPTRPRHGEMVSVVPREHAVRRGPADGVRAEMVGERNDEHLPRLVRCDLGQHFVVHLDVPIPRCGDRADAEVLGVLTQTVGWRHDGREGDESQPRAGADERSSDLLPAAMLGGQDGRDQEAGQDEEHVDAQESAAELAIPEVIAEDGEDRHRPESVQRRPIGEPAAPEPGPWERDP